MSAYISEIRLWPVQWQPENWMFCDGSLLPVAEYQPLYSLIQNRFGGEKDRTFNLPDLRGRIPFGTTLVYSDPPVGKQLGQKSVTLTTENMPSHFHYPQCQTGPGDEQTPVNNYCADEGHETFKLYANQPSNIMSETSKTGSGTPVDTHQPCLGLNYIICFDGLYPPQS